MDDFKRYCLKAHGQVLLLHWITNHLGERQRSGNPALDAIERDFKVYGKTHGQSVDYRFDRGDDLLVFTQSLVVGGVESVERIGCETTKIEIKEFVKERLNCFDGVWSSGILEPEREGEDVTTWTLARRLRNSLSHFRYEYEVETGTIRIMDVRHGNGQQTADFKMTLFNVLDFSYRFGHACALWAEQNGICPSEAGEG